MASEKKRKFIGQPPTNEELHDLADTTARHHSASRTDATTTVPGGAYLSSDGLRWMDANGNTIPNPNAGPDAA